MDVQYPDKPNGYGVIFIAGSGWHAPLGYGAPGLKDQQVSDWGPTLLRAGYMVFSVNHRAAPRFHYPAAVEDVQRAVRFIRHHAEKFGIDPSRIGGVGGSSGAHLVGLVAMLAAPGKHDDADAVNRQPATLQAVVLRAGPSNLLEMKSPFAAAVVASFMERPPLDRAIYQAASPITHVSRTAAPVLLLHGDADDTIPFEQSVAFEAALRTADVPVKLVRVVGGAHGSDFGTAGKSHPQFPAILAETAEWLDRYLKGRV
jgi:acetyl esterase/lipase